MTTIEQLVPIGTPTTRVASEPALTGEVNERSFTLPAPDFGGDPLLADPLKQRKARIGCSSIPFGATPVWPCKKSKKATPVTFACEQMRTCVHWDGQSLSQVPVPVGGNLYGVSARTPTDVWAVGSSGGAVHSAQTLVLHWDCSQWTKVASPNPGPVGNDLYSVRVLSANDVWAAGLSFGGRSHGAGLQLLLLHWNGTRWSTVRVPAIVAHEMQVTGLTGLGMGAPGTTRPTGFFTAFDPTSPTSALALGAHRASNGVECDEILRWNGRQWSPERPAGPWRTQFKTCFYNADLKGVLKVPGGDQWAVGYYCTGRCPPFRPLTLLGNGAGWRSAPSPPGDASLVWLTASSASNVWAVGSWGRPGLHSHLLIRRWNGSKWSQVANPGASVYFTSPPSLVSATDAWAVGRNAAGSRTFLLHWNGAAWSQM